MNSEKVKEIKKALECCKQNEIEETCAYCLDCPAGAWDYEKECNIDLFQKTLILINELESENQRLNKSDTSKEESSIEYYNLYKDLKRKNKDLNELCELQRVSIAESFVKENQLKDWIALLEKDNELLRNAKVVYETVDYCYEDLKKAQNRIAELEKENDDYYERCVILRRENEQLKTLVSSLEKKNIDLEEYIKGNEQDAKAFVNGWHKDLEAELKQFAERLKEKFYYVFGNEYEQSVSGFDTKVLIEHIDETLKEFIND